MTNPTIIQALNQLSEEHARRMRRWQFTINMHLPLFDILTDKEVEFAFDTHDSAITLRVAGDGERFKTIWRTLRQAGWHPNNHPKPEAVSSFCCFWSYPREGKDRWDHDERFVQLWYTYSSTVCKMKKIGTRQVTREEDVYEVDCGQTPLGELLASENDNPQVREG